MFGVVWDNYSSNFEPEDRIPHQKVAKLKSKFWVSLIAAQAIKQKGQHVTKKGVLHQRGTVEDEWIQKATNTVPDHTGNDT